MKNMKILLFAFCLILSFVSSAQLLQKPSAIEIKTLPEWAQKMYGENPNVYEVDELYKSYYRTTLFEKNYHTQYYKRWRKKINNRIQTDGFVGVEIANYVSKHQNSFGNRAGNWSLVGPVISHSENGDKEATQTNVYAIDQSLSNNQVIYCGTEPGEVYKSIDEGLTWTNASHDDALSGGVTAVKIHPTNTAEVLIGSGGNLYRTINSGANWTNVLNNVYDVFEILYDISNPTVVLAATNDGLYRSTDSGQNWTQIDADVVWDIKSNTQTSSTMYKVSNNSTQELAEFYISTDAGLTWTQQTNGWHTSSDPGKNDGGARIAVTPADPNRIYAYLIGESKTGDTGFIGVYKSIDGGATWTLPNGPAGGPYTTTHQNLAIGSPSWQYHQGYYNCAIMASETNPDEILVGGLNLYKSDDAGATFYPLAGYVGGSYPMHVDMQDFRAINGNSWITTDGGIYRSTDFFNTANFEVRMTGVHGAEYWGFDQGWNEDIVVGGLYHNGNLAWYENYGYGNFLSLGGGEAPTGYVNPGENKTSYYSDVDGKIIPNVIGDPITNIGFGVNPNESYWTVESTEFEFDPTCYSIGYIGGENKLWKTEDKGQTFYALHSFGTNVNDVITYIEISRDNPDVMFACQQMSGSNQGKLWKTTDGGVNWTSLSLPSVSVTKRMLIQLDPKNDQNVYIAFESGANMQKIYKSADGGITWSNWSTSTLNNERVHFISFAGGTDGGVYYATNQTVYYRNNTMTDWEFFGDGLPVSMNTNKIKPFYRDGKLRLASYGKGIWESDLYEAQTEVDAQIMVDKLEYTQHCNSETFYYVDHSIINHAGATWNWTFQGGTPATSNTWNEAVTYSSPGTYLTILQVTDGAGNTDTDSLYVTVNAFSPEVGISEDFESVQNLPDYFEVVNADADLTWEKTTTAGGYGNSSSSMLIKGFDYWPGGDVDDARMSVDMTQFQNPMLSFDVAYARYGSANSDTLEILISIDCGASWTSVYYKGGTDLATSPDNTSAFVPNASEWRTDSIDLAQFVGNNDVIINFRSITGWGNNTYIDNINIGTPVSVKENVSNLNVKLYPNPAEKGNVLTLETDAKEQVICSIYSAEGKLVYRKLQEPTDQIQLKDFESGTYIYTIRTSDFIKKGLLVIK